MTVELAVCIPVILAIVGLSLNVLGYLNVCARFDRVAADAVRSQGTSPGYGEEGSALTAKRVQDVIEAAFLKEANGGFNCDFKVEAFPISSNQGTGSNNVDESAGFGGTTGEGQGNSNGVASGADGGSGADSSTGPTFSFLSGLKRYECTLIYHPWPFNKMAFLEFFTLSHTRRYVVDPFKPGVLF